MMTLTGDMLRGRPEVTFVWVFFPEGWAALGSSHEPSLPDPASGVTLYVIICLR
jgi:hypothetical protein